MCKSSLRGDMSEVEFAACIARRMTQYEARGPGDMENAWRRLEQRYAIPWRTFWALRYRQPREIARDVYARLEAAYHSECERQRRRLELELEITKAKVGPHSRVVGEVEALLAETEVGPEHAQGVAPVDRSRPLKS